MSLLPLLVWTFERWHELTAESVCTPCRHEGRVWRGKSGWRWRRAGWRRRPEGWRPTAGTPKHSGSPPMHGTHTPGGQNRRFNPPDRRVSTTGTIITGDASPSDAGLYWCFAAPSQILQVIFQRYTLFWGSLSALGIKQTNISHGDAPAP